MACLPRGAELRGYPAELQLAGAAGLTFAIATLCRNRKLPSALAWLGLVSYSVYLLHPALLEIYSSMPWTQGENFVPTELLMDAVFMVVLLACCALTYRFIEAPMQRKGRQVARWLDDRYGEDVPPWEPEDPGPRARRGQQPVLDGSRTPWTRPEPVRPGRGDSFP